jgi:hypothetical protein
VSLDIVVRIYKVNNIRRLKENRRQTKDVSGTVRKHGASRMVRLTHRDDKKLRQHEASLWTNLRAASIALLHDNFRTAHPSLDFIGTTIRQQFYHS